MKIFGLITIDILMILIPILLYLVELIYFYIYYYQNSRNTKKYILFVFISTILCLVSLCISFFVIGAFIWNY